MNKYLKSLIITLLIVFISVFFIIPVSFLYQSMYLKKLPNLETPLKYKMNYKSLSVITNDGKKLSGWHIPVEKSKGTVLLCHGVSKNKANILKVASIVHSSGYEVYQFDFRGHGDSDESKITYGYDEKKDIKAIINYLKTLGKNHIGIYGLSMGGAIVLLSAPDNPELKVIIIDSTFTSCEGMIRYRIGKYLPEWLTNILDDLTIFYSSAIFGTDIRQITPIKAVRQIHRPILFITGDADKVVLPSNSFKLYEYANQPKELLVIKGLKHAQTINSPVFKTKVIDFLNRYLNNNKNLH